MPWETMMPDLATGIQGGGAGLAVGAAMAAAAGVLRRRGMRVPYTRKIFHFGIFTAAGLVHAVGGLPATNAFGAAVAVLVVAAVVRGPGHLLYDALARPTDHPRERLFIVVPLVTTAVGGLVSALLAGPFAAVGYLVAGWGDAVGEPVGTRWGRHRYRVPSLFGVPAHRTLEGSAAVFVVGAAAAWLALVGIGQAPRAVLLPSLVIAAAAALVEGLSNHGTDNLTVQVTAALAAFLLLG
jgi:phytol kinase